MHDSLACTVFNGGNENSISRRLHFRLRRNKRDARNCEIVASFVTICVSSIHFVARFCSLFLDTLFHEAVDEESVSNSREYKVKILTMRRKGT